MPRTLKTQAPSPRRAAAFRDRMRTSPLPIRPEIRDLVLQDLDHFETADDAEQFQAAGRIMNAVVARIKDVPLSAIPTGSMN